MLNAYWEALNFELPTPEVGKCWYRIIDTSHSLPENVCEIDASSPFKADKYKVARRSCVVLMAKPI